MNGGYSYSSYAGVSQAVVPGDAASSPLYQAVASGQMPRTGARLSDSELALVRDWIDSGAQNN
jgi:hypothetical protein